MLPSATIFLQRHIVGVDKAGIEMSMTMMCNEQSGYSLCDRYYGMSRALCDSTNRLLQWMRQDQAAASMLERIQNLVIGARNVSAASAVFTRLRDYATVFYPGSASAAPDDDASSAADVSLSAVMMYCLPQAVQSMQAAGIPSEIIETTLRDFAIWARVYQDKTGRPGIGETDWNLLSLTGSILRIGRLQYESITFLEPYYVYRRSSDRRIVILAAPNLQVRLDGHLQGANGLRADTGFVTVLKTEGSSVSGNPVDITRGIILAEPITIARDDYDLILAPGTPTTSVHIPEDGSLSPEAVDASFAEAAQLLARLGRQTSTLFCESWLLDPTLELLSSPEGNLCSFMRRFAKFPVASVRPMMVERVFGWGANNFKTSDLPERTSLQRNLKQRLMAGGDVYDVGGVIVIP
ncbi:hypothetical protein EH245_10190 [Bifidobacterium breve]|nr:hypothetical protein EH245_10190 [Bifidobacterium breve]